MINLSIRVVEKAHQWCVVIPVSIARELPYEARYCEVYFYPVPRIIILEFLDHPTEDTYSVELHRRGYAKGYPFRVVLTSLLKTLNIFPGSVAKDYKVIGNKLVIYWDTVIPLERIQLYKLEKPKKLPAIHAGVRDLFTRKKNLYIPENIGRKIDKKFKYCELYYTYEPVRTILIVFKEVKTDESDFSVSRADHRLKITCTILLDLLHLEVGDVAFAYRFLDSNKLLIYWDGVYPYEELKFIKYEKYEDFVKVYKVHKYTLLLTFSARITRNIPSKYIKTIYINKKYKVMIIEFTEKEEEAKRVIKFTDSVAQVTATNEIKELGLTPGQVSKDVEWLSDKILVIYW